MLAFLGVLPVGWVDSVKSGKFHRFWIWSETSIVKLITSDRSGEQTWCFVKNINLCLLACWPLAILERVFCRMLLFQVLFHWAGATMVGQICLKDVTGNSFISTFVEKLPHFRLTCGTSTGSHHDFELAWLRPHVATLLCAWTGHGTKRGVDRESAGRSAYEYLASIFLVEQ